MGFLSKLFGKAGPNAPEMFRNVSRGTDTRLSGSTPGPAVVNAGMGNYFEALRQSKDRTQPPYMAAATASGRIFGGLNRKQLAALGRYLVDNGIYLEADINVPRHEATEATSPSNSDLDWGDFTPDRRVHRLFRPSCDRYNYLH